MSTSATSLLLPQYDNQLIQASVVAADATATTYVLNCPPGTDGNDCGIYDNSLTLGPWASATPAPGMPTTGFYDINYSEDPFMYSLHCPMSHTVANGPCTIINIGGNNDGTETVTATPGDSAFTDAGLDSLTYFPVTITAGLELLKGATATASAEATVPATASETATKGTKTATETAAASHTGSSSTGRATTTTSGTSSGASTSSSSSSTSSSSSSGTSPASVRVPFGLLGLLATCVAVVAISAF